MDRRQNDSRRAASAGERNQRIGAARTPQDSAVTSASARREICAITAAIADVTASASRTSERRRSHPACVGRIMGACARAAGHNPGHNRSHAHHACPMRAPKESLMHTALKRPGDVLPWNESNLSAYPQHIPEAGLRAGRQLLERRGVRRHTREPVSRPLRPPPCPVRRPGPYGPRHDGARTDIHAAVGSAH